MADILSPEKLAELRAKHGTIRTLRVSDSTLALRAPTESECTALVSKRLARKLESQDYSDNGDLEVLACVVHPGPAAREELIADYPLLPRQLEGILKQMAGAGQVLLQDQAVITEEHKRLHGKRLLGFRLGDTPIIMTKLSQFEAQILDRETRQTGEVTVARLAELAAEHLVVPAKEEAAALRARNPLLISYLGMALWEAARAKIEIDLGN